MTITHHPSDATLAAFAGGALDEATTLVVAMHLSSCAACRDAVHGFEAVGGDMLDLLAPEAMRGDALHDAMERLSASSPAAPAEAGVNPLPEVGPGGALLSPYNLGKWRWIGGGVYFRSIDIAAQASESRAFLLKAAPGVRLPHHRHSGSELTCVLQGAFRHQHGRFGPGDFDEADSAVEHSPEIEAGAPCICVVSLQGRVEFQSWLGRLLQPFVRL
jgi:putative transcriptional regulator